MNHEITMHSQGSAQYELRNAILLYHGPNGSVYATIHGIERHRRGGPRLAQGMPATREACGEFAKSITDHAAFRGWIAPEILFIGPRTVAWWRAPAVASLYFETVDEKNKARHIGSRSIRAPQPGLVFVLCESDWSVYAVKGKARPDGATRLWRAPYFNVWKNGRICEGNVQRPERVGPDTLRAFEQAFFGSRFTHPNEQSRELTRYKGGVYALWRDVLDAKHAKAFPEQSLIAHRPETLEGLLRSLEKKAGGERG